MTQLGSISENHLSITCKVCSTHKMLAVKALIERLERGSATASRPRGWEARLQHVVSRLSCSRCKARGQVEFQIVYVGGSGEALLGGKATKDPKPTGRVSE